MFEEWRKQRNKAAKAPDEKCSLKLLEEPEPRSLNRWLSCFVVELRRADGNPYPLSSISNIHAGLYRYSKSQVPDCPNFMDRKNIHFHELPGALQVRYKELRKEGVGAVVKHAPIVTADEEDTLWKTNVIGEDSPLALQRAVFFYCGKCLCLRGGEEQRSLKVTGKRSTHARVRAYGRPYKCTRNAVLNFHVNF